MEEYEDKLELLEDSSTAPIIIVSLLFLHNAYQLSGAPQSWTAV